MTKPSINNMTTTKTNREETNGQLTKKYTLAAAKGNSTNNQTMLQQASDDNNTCMIDGQIWHIGFNNASVLSALLGEISDDNSLGLGSLAVSSPLDDFMEYEHFSKLIGRNSLEKSSEIRLSSPPRVHRKSPPVDYSCKLCNFPGHWLEDCKFYRPHRSPSHSNYNQLQEDILPPPSNYICRLCSTPGHWIDQCSKFTPRPSASPVTPRAPPKPVPINYACKLCGCRGHWIQHCPKFVPHPTFLSRRR